MKKNLKTLLILLTIIVSFIGLDVKAKTIEPKESFTKHAESKHNVEGLSIIGNNTYGMYKYSFVDTTNESFVGYCMDPHKDASNGYKVDRILGDTSYTKRITAFDLGILEIMKNGKNQYNDSLKFTIDGSERTISGDSLYAATSIAVRAFALGVFGYGGDIESAKSSLVPYYKAVASAHITRAIQWASYSLTKINAITVTNCTGTGDEFRKCYENNFIKGLLKNTWYDNKSNINVTSANSEGYLVIYAAQHLFQIGLTKSYEVMNGTATTATLSGKANNTSVDKTTVGNRIEEYYHSEIEFKNFDAEKGKIINFNLVCEDCAKNNITLGNLEIYNPMTTAWETLRSTYDALSYFKETDGKKSGKIELRFKVSRIKDDENCKSVNYKITYKYNDPSLEYIGALLKASSTSKQRFFILQKTKEDLTGNVSGTIKCSVSCDTEIEMPVCSYNEDDANAKIDAPTKIKTCIIDNEDDAGNSYQFTTEAGGVDNAYCKVYCKEDYAEIKLNPIVTNVKCGGYFKLTSKINGTKTCYTGGDTTKDARNGAKSIDVEQYLRDIKNVQENMVDAMNRYYEYKAKKEHVKSASTYYQNMCGKNSCEKIETFSINWQGYLQYVFKWDEAAESGSYTTYNAPASGTSFWDSPNPCKETKNDKNEIIKSCGGFSSYAATEYQEWVNNVNDEYNRAISDLSSLIEQYKLIIRDYNSCTTGWVNEFPFAQKLKYYYDENRGENNTNYSPYFDLLNGKEELQYLDKDGSEKETTVIKICKKTASESYECLGDAAEDKTATIENAPFSDEYNYKASYGSDVFAGREYVKCSVAKGCEIDARKISEASFIKKEVTKEQKYITPTAFYQIAANGKVIAYDNYSIDKIQLEPLVNKLPVSTSSVGGGVFKLMIENLGEFYGEKNAYGRLIDFGQSNETRSVAYAKGVNTFDGEYSCYYENTCRPKDCPDCDFVCEGDGCEWKECPDCDFTCINCIFDLGSLNLNVKTITTTDVNAANRTHGYNWITSSSMEALNLLNRKASTTISEIEEINEMVYDDKTTDGSTLGFSIKLTPEIISKITKYNKDNQNSGGYINNSLTCYDATIDGETYSNIYCYSELIDKLVNENGDNVTVLPSRINDEARRASETNSSGYWTLWSNYKIDKTSESVIGGPSWK